MNTKRRLIQTIKTTPGMGIVFRSLLRTKMFVTGVGRYATSGVGWLLSSRETTNMTTDLTPSSEKLLTRAFNSLP
jgi:hypothetical protein